MSSAKWRPFCFRLNVLMEDSKEITTGIWRCVVDLTVRESTFDQFMAWYMLLPDPMIA